jgi:biotin operon repressor
MSFLLGLSGFAGNRWASGIGLDSISATPTSADGDLSRCLQLLSARYMLSADQVAAELGLDRRAATQQLDRLTRQGRVMFELDTHGYRHRELFATPVDEAALYPPDARQAQASAWLEQGQVKVGQCEAEETRKARRFRTERGPIERDVIHRDWRATGQVADQSAVTVVLDDAAQLIFGQCGCEFFRDNLLNRGPCAHMLAMVQSLSGSLRDLPTSRPADPRFTEPRAGQGGREDDADVDKDDDDGDKAG